MIRRFHGSLALLGTLLGALAAPGIAPAQHLLVPMDRSQATHLQAYGLTYWVLERAETAEWF